LFGELKNKRVTIAPIDAINPVINTIFLNILHPFSVRICFLVCCEQRPVIIFVGLSHFLHFVNPMFFKKILDIYVESRSHLQIQEYDTTIAGDCSE